MIDRSILALPGIKKILLLLVIFGLGQAFFVLGQAWSLSSAITGLWQGSAFSDEIWWFTSFLICFILQQAVIYAQSSVLDSYAYRQAHSLRQRLLERVFAVGRPFTQAGGTGSTATTIIEGVEQVEIYLRLILPKITGVIAIPLVLLIASFTLDWVSGTIMLLTFPFIILYMVILGHNAKDKAAKQYGVFQQLSNHFIDSLRGLDTLKYFGRSKQHGESIFGVSERFRKATMKTLRVATLSSLVLDLFATLSLAAVAIMLGLRLIDGSLQLFPALTILIIVPQFYKPVKDFASDYHASLDGKNAFAAINELVLYEEDVSPHVCLPTWQLDTSLSVEGLTYSYPDHQALSDINFTIKGYANVGIIGMSGSGKSTLIDLMGGFRSPERGTISIDGRSVGDLKQKDWQKQVVYIPQSPYIFHESLRDNIAFYHPEAGERDVVQAVSMVGLDELVDELPSGLDTVIGEGERSLSGGQAQRIALARAFLDDSRKVMLFDEPTAHLDVETERELKDRMLPLLSDKLVFFATHRLHWLQEMDQVIVLDQGKILDVGTVEELTERHGSIEDLVFSVRGERP